MRIIDASTNDKHCYVNNVEAEYSSSVFFPVVSNPGSIRHVYESHVVVALLVDVVKGILAVLVTERVTEWVTEWAIEPLTELESSKTLNSSRWFPLNLQNPHGFVLPLVA